MKYSYTIICTFFISGFTYAKNNSLSQSTLQFSKKFNPMFFLGTGFNIPNTALKKQAYLLYPFNINMNFYQTIVRKKSFSLGLNLGGEHGWSRSDQIKNLPDPYHIENESWAVVTFISAKTPSKIYYGSGGEKTQLGYNFELGPQLNLFLGEHVIISPIFQAGYMHLVQRGFNVIQKNSINSWTYSYNLLRQSEMITKGFAITPKLRIQYALDKSASSCFWIEANYMMGPIIKNTVNIFSPEGSPDSNGRYTLAQMQGGSIKGEARETKYNLMGVNFGMAVSIRKE